MKTKTIRCNSKNPTPYLIKHIDLFTECAGGNVIDLGCGNGRNSKYLRKKGMHVMSLDAKPDYGIYWLAGEIPTEDHSADYILCNYLLMFLEDHTRNTLYDEIDRISHIGTRCMIELENVKSSVIDIHALNVEVLINMTKRSWYLLHSKKYHYIFEKT